MFFFDKIKDLNNTTTFFFCRVQRFSSGNDPQDPTGCRVQSSGHHTVEGVARLLPNWLHIRRVKHALVGPQHEIVFNQLRTLVMQDCWIMIRELAERKTSPPVHSIMKKDLGFRRISVQVVPKLLTIEGITPFVDCTMLETVGVGLLSL